VGIEWKIKFHSQQFQIFGLPVQVFPQAEF